MTTSAEATQFIDSAQSYGKDAFDRALNYIDDAVTFAQGWATWNYPTLEFDVGTIDPPVYADAPDKFDDTYKAPTSRPTVPTYDTLYVPQLFNYPNAPDILDTSNLFQFARPDFNIGEFDEVAPEVKTDFNIGTAPVYNEIDAPEVRGINIPSVPDITLPSFDSTFEGVDPGAIEDVAQRFKNEYEAQKPGVRAFVDDQAEAWTAKYCPAQHTALARLESKLDTGMDGGTALSDTIEQQIFQRGRDRVEREKSRVDMDIAKVAGKRGYVIPPGVMTAGLNRAQQEAADNISRHASDTAIERARLEIQHAQFIINASATLRQMMIGSILQSTSMYLQVNEQASNIAQQTAVFVVETYNKALELYEKKLSLYRIAAEIFEVELKSALAEFEKVRAELEVANLTKDVERLEVDVYSQRISAQESRLRFFQGELEAIDKQISQENLKLQLYGEKARVYGIRAQAKEAEFNGYRAAIAGDTGRVQAHSEQIRAYAAEIDGVASRSRADIAHSEAITQNNRNLADTFRAEISSYQSDVDAEGKRFDGSVQSYRTLLDTYLAENNLKLDTLKTDYDKSRIELSAKQTEYNGDLQSVRDEAARWHQHVGMLANTATAAAGVSQSLASAALNAQNSMVLLANETVTQT